eukprot:TRINITY_DN2784_c0_g1_i9.p1 TRINITY_DN2784_c0_g1~~TRINITY_DN2784_c0_g1_i9.p1  ORF type:complete len:202 (+),score=-21.58 TRINITY_DN2784_c0_g1_i9:418-1023(+)
MDHRACKTEKKSHSFFVSLKNKSNPIQQLHNIPQNNNRQKFKTPCLVFLNSLQVLARALHKAIVWELTEQIINHINHQGYFPQYAHVICKLLIIELYNNCQNSIFNLFAINQQQHYSTTLNSAVIPNPSISLKIPKFNILQVMQKSFPYRSILEKIRSTCSFLSFQKQFGSLQLLWYQVRNCCICCYFSICSLPGLTQKTS